MSVASLARVKWAIRNISSDQAKAILAEVLDMDDPLAVREHVEKVLESVGLGGLVRAGK
jgi:phosphotransferase system enzyme I (PtsP)